MARTRLYPPSVDPGFPQLPPTPDGWTHATFADVLDVVERPKKLNHDATYRLLTAKRSRGGIALRGELLGREILTKTQFEAKGGDFLISRRQIIHGACGLVPAELDGAVVSNEYSTLRARPNLTMDFLRHYSHTPYFQRTCFHSSHGVDVEKMIFKIDEWLAREVNVPPLPEQRKISAILSSVDDAMAATQAVIEQLGVLKKAMMAELLTRGLPGRHTRFKQTEIGEVPDDWFVVRFEELLAEGDALSYGILQPGDDAADGVPMLRTVDFDNDGRRANTSVLRVAETIERTYERTRLRGGEVLLSVMGTVGRPVAVDPAWRGWNVNRALAVIRPNGRISQRFLTFWLRSPATQARFNAEQIGSAQKRINLGDLREMRVPVPDSAEQERICEVIQSLDDRHRREQDVRDSLTESKSALMSVLLTGEVRVKPDEDAA
jgi:type I restriction enzyme S subunit